MQSRTFQNKFVIEFGCDAVELEYFAAICARTGASGPRNNVFA